MCGPMRKFMIRLFIPWCICTRQDLWTCIALSPLDQLLKWRFPSADGCPGQESLPDDHLLLSWREAFVAHQTDRCNYERRKENWNERSAEHEQEHVPTQSSFRTCIRVYKRSVSCPCACVRDNLGLHISAQCAPTVEAAAQHQPLLTDPSASGRFELLSVSQRLGMYAHLHHRAMGNSSPR